MNTEIKIIIGIVIVLIIIIIGIFNALISRHKLVERNKSLIDVFLKKRYDLIPNLVEVCKGYSNFEKEAINNVIKARNTYMSDPSSDNTNKLNSDYNKLLALAESYPDLKANTVYLNLQKEIVNVENEIQASRRIYINSITSYNNLVMIFPASIIAKIANFKTIELPKLEYDDVKVKF